MGSLVLHSLIENSKGRRHSFWRRPLFCPYSPLLRGFLRTSSLLLIPLFQCKTAEELIALAKTGGYELTKEEAEAYMAELEDLELDEENIKKIAGGRTTSMPCAMKECSQRFALW